MQVDETVPIHKMLYDYIKAGIEEEFEHLIKNHFPMFANDEKAKQLFYTGMDFRIRLQRRFLQITLKENPAILSLFMEAFSAVCLVGSGQGKLCEETFETKAADHVMPQGQA